MSNLVLTRKAGQSVRLMIGGEPVFLDMEAVCGGFCKILLSSPVRIERLRFRDSMQIAEGVTVTVLDLAKGHAKLNFTAPREVAILRTELIKDEI